MRWFICFVVLSCSVVADDPKAVDDPDIYGIRFTAPYCVPCKVYDSKDEKDVVLPFKLIDVSNDEGAKIASESGVTEIPAWIICDRHLSTELIRVHGYQTSVQINTIVTTARGVRAKRKKRNEALVAISTVRIRCNHDKGYDTASGVIVKANGFETYVLTAAHAVEKDVTNVMVEPIGQQQGVFYAADVLASEPDTDLAVLKITTNKKLQYLSDIGKCESVGANVIVSGYPEGGDFSTVTTTINRATIANGIHVLVTDSQVKHGISGGPLTLDGTIVGIASCIDTKEHTTWFANGDSIRKILASINKE